MLLRISSVLPDFHGRATAPATGLGDPARIGAIPQEPGSVHDLPRLRSAPGETKLEPWSASRADHLTITGRREADQVILTLCGEIDLASAPSLERELRYVESTRPRRIELDLSDLRFIDSTGVHLLIEAQRRADADGHQLVITHVPTHARRLFDLTRASSLLTLG